MYVPFAPEGFSLIIVLINSLALSLILSAVKETFPTEAWIIPVLSTLKSIFHLLYQTLPLQCP